MKEIVKYILILGLGVLALYHRSDGGGLMDALYFGEEYFTIGILLIYLATSSKGNERWFFGILSTYYGLKLVYNALLYIEPIAAKIGLSDGEFWGWIFTSIIILILIVIQVVYVVKKR